MHVTEFFQSFGVVDDGWEHLYADVVVFAQELVRRPVARLAFFILSRGEENGRHNMLSEQLHEEKPR